MFSSQTYEERDLEPITRVYEECRHGDIPEGDGLDSCIMCSPRWTEEPSGWSAPNPILVYVREYHEMRFARLRDVAGSVLSAFDDLFVVEDATPDQREHARRVLKRLAA